MSYITKKSQFVFLFFLVTNKIKINNSNLGLLLFIFMGILVRIIIVCRAVGVAARYSCLIGLTDKLKRNPANFKPPDSLSVSGF